MEENRNPPKRYHFFHPFKSPNISTMFKSNTHRQKKEKHDNISMEETVSLVLEGCKLAKDVESNMENLSQQPHLLFNSCDQLVKVFDNAKRRLQCTYDQPHEQQQGQQLQMDASFQEWLQSNYTQAMDIFQTHLLVERSSIDISNRTRNNAGDDDHNDQLQVGGNLNIPAMDVTVFPGRSPAGPSSSSSSQRPRKRKESMDTRIERMDAPRIGNTEIPPEDGFTWRKYGQKEIMGSRFPRSYYRCTHQKLYQCPAKKQVQRLDNDPYTFEVIYRGSHTCHMSATAPSALPPPPPPPPVPSELTQGMSQLAMTTTSTSVSTTAFPVGRSWLSMEFGRGGGGSSSSGAGTSTGRFGKEAEEAVIDMADVMFNSGGSSSNTMDFIFSSMDKWDLETGDKKDTDNANTKKV